MWRGIWACLLSACCSQAGEAGFVNTSQGQEQLRHALSPELQHSLSTLLLRHGSLDKIEDPGVSALLGDLLHDELEAQGNVELLEETQRARDTDEVASAQASAHEEQERKQHLQKMEELEAARKAHEAEMHAIEIGREAAKLQAQNKAAERQRVHQELMQSNNEFMQKSRARREKAERSRVAMQERHAKHWERASSLLRQVHEELEDVTNGWRDAPFWDDFFRTSSAATRFSQIGYSHIEPALSASSLVPKHTVLVLEPRGASLAERLAGEIRSKRENLAVAHAYGAESDERRDLVVEVGLLDAMAMGNAGGGVEISKLGALQNASSRLAQLVRPGGTWISISAVPPTLRLPLLGRLAGSTFMLPGDKESADTGTHAMVLSAGAVKDKGAIGLRGASQVADMLLYGSEDVHVWAYRMRRGEDSEGVEEDKPPPAAHGDALIDIIRQQRPGTRDDL